MNHDSPTYQSFSERHKVITEICARNEKELVTSREINNHEEASSFCGYESVMMGEV